MILKNAIGEVVKICNRAVNQVKQHTVDSARNKSTQTWNVFQMCGNSIMYAKLLCCWPAVAIFL